MSYFKSIFRLCEMSDALLPPPYFSALLLEARPPTRLFDLGYYVLLRRSEKRGASAARFMKPTLWREICSTEYSTRLKGKE